MLDLTHLRTFLEVYREGSLTKAAARLHIAQPTATQHVRALEAQCGTVLFERSARGITATGHAHDLATRAAGPLDELASISASHCSAHASSALHVGGPGEFLAERALPALAPLVHDGVRVHGYIDHTADLLDQVAEGTLDLVISLARTDDRRLRFHLLVEEPLALVASPKVLLDDLEAVPLIAYDARLPLVKTYFLHVFGHEPKRAPSAMFASQYAVRAFVGNGGGMAVMPLYLAKPALESGELVLAHDPVDPPTLAYFLATRTSPRSDLLERASVLIADAV